ncbi:ABC transporter substrate-binding protein [Caryophanon tenue]|uniref:ABC transporter substrate-binding protein n=1 Tax=Caryophanon tenue TaxID=33978 RepID=A0A1C0YDC8_9BACL|nr:ABC transporter substrate-binding protein [Caryophanon tenue]OCS85123.1 ABC transporter substrate-binding protein [Caryophanon tenue]
MNKKWMATLAFSALLLAACGNNEEATTANEEATADVAQTAEERLITDQLGREVAVTETDRIVTGGLLPYPSAWYFATGSGEEIVGMHPNSYSATENSILAKLAPEMLDASTAFVKNGEMNIEELMNINPDIYFELSTDEKTIEQAEKAGIPTMGVKTFDQSDAEPLATYTSWLELTSEITGKAERKDMFIEEGDAAQAIIDEKLATVDAADKPKILFLYGASADALTVTGANFFGEQWIKATGGIDVAAEAGVTGRKDVNMEQIYEWNPDIIYITNFTPAQPEDLYTNGIGSFDWSTLDAVKNKQVHKVPLGIYRWYPPSGDAPLMLKWMAQKNYPALFDYDMNEEIKAYYTKFYDYNLTDEEVDSILHPVSEAAKVTK